MRNTATIGYCLYTFLPLRSPLPSMNVVFNGINYPVDPNFDVSSLEEQSPLRQEFLENADLVRAYFCRNITSTGGQFITVNQTSAGSMQLRGIGAYRRLYHDSAFQNSSVLGAVIAAAVIVLVCLSLVCCCISKKRRARMAGGTGRPTEAWAMGPAVESSRVCSPLVSLLTDPCLAATQYNYFNGAGDGMPRSASVPLYTHRESIYCFGVGSNSCRTHRARRRCAAGVRSCAEAVVILRPG
jgi:hypothetical protein